MCFRCFVEAIKEERFEIPFKVMALLKRLREVKVVLFFSDSQRVINPLSLTLQLATESSVIELFFSNKEAMCWQP